MQGDFAKLQGYPPASQWVDRVLPTPRSRENHRSIAGKVGFSMRLAPPPEDVGSNQGLEATFTERGSTTIEKPVNRSKSGARSHLYPHDFTMSERGLENCCAGNRTEGSNPSLSDHKMARRTCCEEAATRIGHRTASRRADTTL